jgi:hypothetical protein
MRSWEPQDAAARLLVVAGPGEEDMSLEGSHVHAGPAADLQGELVDEVRLARLGDEQADKAVGTGPGDDEDVKDGDRRSVLGPRRYFG